MELKIEIKGLKEMQAAFLKSPEITARHLNWAIKRIMTAYEREAVKSAPVDTGNLRNRRTSILGNLKGFLSFNVKYAEVVHEGSKAHWIRPKNRPFLAWKPRGGDWVYTKKPVFIRQKAGCPFLRNAINYLEKEKENTFAQAVEKITKEMTRG